MKLQVFAILQRGLHFTERLQPALDTYNPCFLSSAWANGTLPEMQKPQAWSPGSWVDQIHLGVGIFLVTE